MFERKVKPLRVAVITPRFPSLSETFILNHITGLIDLGHEVDIYATKQEDDACDSAVRNYNLLGRTRSMRMPVQKYEWMAMLPSMVGTVGLRLPFFIHRMIDRRNHMGLVTGFDLLKHLNGVRYDIVHCHYAPFANRLLWIKYLLDTRYVVHCHGWGLVAYGSGANRAYEELFEKADGFIANTDYLQRGLEALGCSKNKIFRLPSSLNVDRFKFRPRTIQSGDTVKLLTVARLVKEKGLDYSIRAVGKLAKRYPLQYDIVGEGAERPYLESLIEQLDLTGRVFLRGGQVHENVIKFLDEAHIFVLASITLANGLQDNGPNVIKEAEASGIPVVSTNIGAIPEVLENGVSGFLVPERDVDALAGRLEYLIEHPEVWPDMGIAGRRFVAARFDMKALSEQCQVIYQNLLWGGS